MADAIPPSFLQELKTRGRASDVCRGPLVQLSAGLHPARLARSLPVPRCAHGQLIHDAVRRRSEAAPSGAILHDAAEAALPAAEGCQGFIKCRVVKVRPLTGREV